MSEPLTAAGALVKALTPDPEKPLLYIGRDLVGDIGYMVRCIEAEAAARAVDEALSVERVAEALHATLCGDYPDPSSDDRKHAAALVAHLRGPR